jgi:hypothetical protein
MAGGSSKPIAAVRVGDRIANSVPGDTTVQTHTVDWVIVTSTDHDFVDVDFVDVTVKTSVTSRVKAAAAKALAGTALAVAVLTALACRERRPGRHAGVQPLRPRRRR